MNGNYNILHTASECVSNEERTCIPVAIPVSSACALQLICKIKVKGHLDHTFVYTHNSATQIRSDSVYTYRDFVLVAADL